MAPAALLSYLIVDDHGGMRSLIKELLPEPSGEIVECGNGVEAVEQYRLKQPDLVVMDISMPLMNGIDATLEILRIQPGAKVIILTNHEDETTRDVALSSGAAAFLSKSRISELPGVVESMGNRDV